MSDQHDMEHMNYLDAVAHDDVAVLRQKEATYQGSWKRAGGASAWFMLRRNMDRLLEMMKPPTTPHGFSMADLDDLIETPVPVSPDGGDCCDRTLDVSILKYLRDCYVAGNIFAMIRDAPGGEDGTVLAVMRDLRRYCLLVEAEMVARGVIEEPSRYEYVELSEQDVANAARNVEESRKAILTKAAGRALNFVLSIPEGDPTDVYAMCAEIMGVSREEAKLAMHAYGFSGSASSSVDVTITGDVVVRPDVHQQVDVMMLGTGIVIGLTEYLKIPPTVADLLYEEWVGKKVYVLKPHLSQTEAYRVQMASPSHHGIVSTYYDEVGVTGFVLRVQDAPQSYRYVWPVLAAEYNQHEMTKLPLWTRSLYDYVKDASKWVVKNKYEAWTKS